MLQCSPPSILLTIVTGMSCTGWAMAQKVARQRIIVLFPPTEHLRVSQKMGNSSSDSSRALWYYHKHKDPAAPLTVLHALHASRVPKCSQRMPAVIYCHVRQTIFISKKKETHQLFSNINHSFESWRKVAWQQNLWRLLVNLRRVEFVTIKKKQ